MSEYVYQTTRHQVSVPYYLHRQDCENFTSKIYLPKKYTILDTTNSKTEGGNKEITSSIGRGRNKEITSSIRRGRNKEITSSIGRHNINKHKIIASRNRHLKNRCRIH